MRYLRYSLFIASALLIFSLSNTTDAEAASEGLPYCPALSTALQRGARDATSGGQVSELQKFLASYFDLDTEEIVSGYFGKITQSYVISFQKERSLSAEGIVGPLTRAKIAKGCVEEEEVSDGGPIRVYITSQSSNLVRGRPVTISWKSENAPPGAVVAIDLIDTKTREFVGDGVVGMSKDTSHSYTWTVPFSDNLPFGYCPRATDIPGVCGSDLIDGHLYQFRVTLASNFECRGFCLKTEVTKYASDESDPFTISTGEKLCTLAQPVRPVCKLGEEVVSEYDGSGCLISLTCKMPKEPSVTSDRGTRDLQRVKDMQNLKGALAAYFQDHGKYPATAPNDQGPASSYTNLQAYLVPQYLPSLPHDPYLVFNDPNWNDYGYIRGADATQSYGLWIRFEDGYPGAPGVVAPGGSCKAGVNMNGGWYNPPGTLCPGQHNRVTRDEMRLNDIRTLKNALAAYVRDNGVYPSTAPDDQGPASSYLGLEAALVPKYLSVLPHDPLRSDPNWGDYSYIRGPATSKSYGLWVRFENGHPNTPGAVAPGGSCKTGVNMNPGWWNPPGTLCPQDINESAKVGILPATLAAVGAAFDFFSRESGIFVGGIAAGLLFGYIGLRSRKKEMQ